MVTRGLVGSSVLVRGLLSATSAQRRVNKMVAVVPPETSSLELHIQPTADDYTFSLSVWVLHYVIIEQHRLFLSLFNPANVVHTLLKADWAETRGELD